MKELVEFLNSDEMMAAHPKSRIWITSQMCKKFPLALLQNSIKVTNEPPRGIRNSMHKIFSNYITSDELDRIEHANWKTLIFYMSFLHSIVIERRKFGPLGWCVPYQFNYSDLEASLTFIEQYVGEHFSKLSFQK